MSITVSGIHSRAHPVTSCVFEGSVLAPLLFLIFINHLGSNLICNYMIIVDDLNLYIQHSAMPNLTISGELQHSISTLAHIASSWGLKFATNKCVHLRFKHGADPLHNQSYHLEGNVTQIIFSLKDLVVLVDSRLRFHLHIRETVSKAVEVAPSLLKSTLCCSSQFMTALLISDDRPSLDFAFLVWNTGFLGDLVLLESVQCTGLSRQTNSLTSLSRQSKPFLH